MEKESAVIGIKFDEGWRGFSSSILSVNHCTTHSSVLLIPSGLIDVWLPPQKSNCAYHQKKVFICFLQGKFKSIRKKNWNLEKENRRKLNFMATRTLQPTNAQRLHLCVAIPIRWGRDHRLTLPLKELFPVTYHRLDLTPPRFLLRCCWQQPWKPVPDWLPVPTTGMSSSSSMATKRWVPSAEFSPSVRWTRSPIIGHTKFSVSCILPNVILIVSLWVGTWSINHWTWFLIIHSGSQWVCFWGCCNNAAEAVEELGRASVWDMWGRDRAHCGWRSLCGVQWMWLPGVPAMLWVRAPWGLPALPPVQDSIQAPQRYVRIWVDQVYIHVTAK